MELAYQVRQVEIYTFRGFEAFTSATLVYVVISLIITGLVTLYSRKILTPILDQGNELIDKGRDHIAEPLR